MTHLVKIDYKGRALEHVVHVSKNGHDNVMWIDLDNQGPWKITFDKDGGDSPFESEYFVPKNGNVKTTNGPHSNAVVGQTYRYNVRNATTNAITNDPDIDIEG